MRVDENRLTAAYIMANRNHGALYLGSALDLIVRVSEHRDGVGSKHVAKYGITKLVGSSHSCWSARPATASMK